MENEELNNNQLPPHQVEEKLDEVAPRCDRILRDYARPDNFEGESSVRRPPIAANNFEIRTGLIQTIQQSCQFTGDVSEDPHTHLIDFLELVETCRYNGVTTDAIRLRLFPFSLKGEAKTWLRSLPRGSITTWDQMTQKFLNKYFSPAKIFKMKQKINNFMQTDSESIYQAWERLKAMLRKCPHHGIQDPGILYIFYHALKPSAKNVIDAASGGSIMSKTIAEAMKLLNEILENVNNQSSSQLENCDVCGGNHPNHECQASTQNEEQVNMIGYRNNYSFGSPMAQKHPGFQWSNPNGAENPQRFFNQKQQVQGLPGFQNQNKGQQNFQQNQQQPHRAHQQSLEDLMYKFIKATDEKVESQHSAIKNLEIQVSQLATLMSGQIKGSLPSNTEKNPKEHLKAISLRSGKTLDDPYADRQGNPQEVEQVNESKNKKDSELLKEQKDKGKKVQENELMTNPYSVPLPFPQKLKREKLDKQFSKFLEMLKQLYINIPFTNALKQMPAYAKFLKEILSSSFTIPYTLGGAHFEKALCDSGASINLMPFLIFRKLELGEMKDTSVSLQLADQSTKTPKGILENVLVRVDKFIFSVDFIVLEMEENTEVPLILGKPFLATGRAIIDVH
ncbi:uncharacterized protein [Nicotiana sylvestris]|uniref:uncharacterized protein n=1 Tax=Nicotiana sylvestris TaxID=4096 RepID=UPI00388CA092